jgi:hypothetical protein
MDQILRTLLEEWRERKLPQVINRDISFGFLSDSRVNNAMVVTGFRRVGKTYILFQEIEKLLKIYSKEDVIYINFEDERIINPKTDLLSKLIPEIQSLFGKKPKYLFLDELQIIPNWSKWVRRILDTEDIKLVITGSSSKMGSSELPTELRGRSWEVKVEPLSFKEFLGFKNIRLDYKNTEFNYYFNEYLKFGGLPAVVLSPEEKKNELLQSYFQTVVQKEIIDRQNIRNENVLKILLKLLLNSSYITISKLFNNMKSVGLPVGKTTIDKYISYIEDSYFLNQVRIFSPKVVNQLFYPRKIYFIDNGLLNALSTKFSKNYGRSFENLVYQKLRKSNEDIYYWKDQSDREVDFVILENGKVTALYQACFDISDEETLKRETKSLLRAKEILKCDNLNLISLEKPTNYEPSKIKLITANEFFI